MPIYAYRCSACQHAQDILRKISDPALTLCPACQTDNLVKQVTSAGFALKGSGWYVTDFRGGNTGGGAKDAHKDKDTTAESASTPSGASDKADTPSAPAKQDTAASSVTTASPAPSASPAPVAATRP